jgi:PAS domain S-box-containing protein
MIYPRQVFWRKTLPDILIVAVLYFLTARTGQLLAIPPGNVTPVWIPSGLVLAAVLLRGFHVWPGVFVGAFLGNAWAYFDSSSIGSVGASVFCGTANGIGDALGAVVGGYLIRHSVGRGQVFAGSGSVFKFIAYGAVLGPAISALFGVTSLSLAGFVPWSLYPSTLLTWWTGDSAGVLLITPLVLAWAQPLRAPFPGCLECLAFIASLLVANAYCLDYLPVKSSYLAHAVFIAPILLWGTFRCQQRALVTAVVVIAAMAIVATVRGHGPFVTGSLTRSLIQLQLFTAVMAITLFLFSSMIAERKRVERSLRASEATFSEVFKSAPVMMLLLDEDRRVRLMNPAADNSLIRWEHDVLGQAFGDAVGCINATIFGGCGRSPHCGNCSIGHVVSETYQTGRGQGPAEVKFTLARDGVQQEGNFLVTTALPDLPDRREVLVCVEDITESKRAEQEIQTNLRIQEVIGSILHISLEPIPLEEVLQRTLDRLFSIPWLALQSRGCIFLTGDGSEELVMQVQRGLPGEVIDQCKTIPAGTCLCGRAALTKEIVFVAEVDERHEGSCQQTGAHGHYCVPIVSDGRLRGLMNLYVNEGHKRRPEEEIVLASVASILATIIERRKAEKALRSSEERFDLAVRGTDAGIWDWDLKTNEVYFSPRWKSILGYKDGEIENHFSEWEDRLHPDDRDRARTTIQDYLDGRTTDYELEHRLRHKDGTYRWILSRGAMVRDQEGKPHRMVGSHIDFTARKEAEDALHDREAQLRVAQTIQEHLLPDKAPEVPGFDFAGASYPAEFAAGDHFDYLAMPDGSVGLAIGDVSGHGFGPALLMASTCAHLRSLAETGIEIDEILARVNKSLSGETEDGHFITAILGRLDRESMTLIYANAGHPPGYVLDTSGRVKAKMESTSFPLAIMPDAEFPLADPITLEPGDLVLLVTDGLLETSSPDREMFRMDRVLEVVRQHLEESASDIIEHVYQAVRDFSGGQEMEDDVTVLVVKAEPVRAAADPTPSVHGTAMAHSPEADAVTE